MEYQKDKENNICPLCTQGHTPRKYLYFKLEDHPDWAPRSMLRLTKTIVVKLNLINKSKLTYDDVQKIKKEIKHGK